MPLQLHQDPLTQLIDVISQQRYLQDRLEVPIIPEPIEEREPIDAGIIVE